MLAQIQTYQLRYLLRGNNDSNCFSDPKELNLIILINPQLESGYSSVKMLYGLAKLSFSY
jgi:hypothetical protein